MLIQKSTAQALLDDMTEGCSVPVASNALTQGWFGVHGHLFVGAHPIRGYKYKANGKWRFDDREVRRAAQALLDLQWDPQDLVKARIGSTDRAGANWRADVRSWMNSAAFSVVLENGCACSTESCSRPYGLVETGLPCGLSMDVFRETCQKASIAGTLPLSVLTWQGGDWWVPRAYAKLLAQWEKADDALADKARACTSCGAKAGYSDDWRVSGSSGWTTLCPTCAASGFRPYRGHLRGVRYRSARMNAVRADDYLCVLCKSPRRAYYWDHCHEHDCIRGPVCASCNTFEGHGMNYVARSGSLSHLLECAVCRSQRTLPARHRDDALRNHLSKTEPHHGCRARLEVTDVRTEADGTVCCRISCTAFPDPHAWERKLSASEAAEIIEDLVGTVTSQSTPPAGQLAVSGRS
ncbi:endonuclease VII [Streptomyces sp. YC504]|uniref:Endonuclease VII n=1 Tax=Streptomyces mesophilus TaxID=1775132 RepID=A0A6G4XD90_9ACTN|nr:endonuclease domain-containing protein [Streptomyces mesophilus]NGO75203.1 endonuclease VII [Streptomyces mesophilus]